MKNSFPSLSLVPDIQEVMNHAFRCPADSIPPVVLTLPYSVEPECFLNGLCDDLEKAELLRFTGDRRWLNFRLDYCVGTEFPSFSLMLECMHRHSGYRNEFGGVVRVDLTDWTGYTDDNRLDDSLAFIHDFSDRVLFIVSVSTDDPRIAAALKSKIRRWTNCVTADVAKPSAEVWTGYAAERLSASGHLLTADAQQLLSETVGVLSEQMHFAGMREINALVSAILNEIGSIRRISAKHMAAFSADGEWVASHMDTEKFIIGFSGGNPNDRQ